MPTFASEPHHRIPLRRFIRAEDELQRLEIVRAGGFAGAFAAQRRQQIAMARHHAGLSDVVARIRPRVARRRVPAAVRSRRRGDAQHLLDQESGQRFLRRNLILPQPLPGTAPATPESSSV